MQRIGVPSVPSLTVICLGEAVALLVLVLDRKRGPQDVTKPQAPDVDPMTESRERGLGIGSERKRERERERSSRESTNSVSGRNRSPILGNVGIMRS